MPHPTPPAPPLDEAATKVLVARYEAAEHCGPKAAMLLALQDWWHPSGVAMVRSALIGKQLRRRNTCKHYRVRVETALQRLVPNAAASGASSWARWWRQNAAAHRPAAWRAMPPRQAQQPGS